MARFNLYFILTLHFFVLLGCGKFDRIENDGFTKVTFSRGGLTKATQLGGVLIYIYSDTYATNMKLSDETQPASITLPNGSYSFYAFSYDSGTLAFTDNTECAVVGNTTPVVLDGTSQTINLNLTFAGCTDGVFASNSNYLESNNFARLEFVHCNTTVDVTTQNGTGTCAGGNWPTAMRYKLIAPIYRSDQNGFIRMANGISGSCQTASTSGMASAPATSERFPVGNTSTRGGKSFAIEVETYSDPSCTSTAIATHNFHKGLLFGPDPDSNLLGFTIDNPGAPNKTRIFLRQP